MFSGKKARLEIPELKAGDIVIELQGLQKHFSNQQVLRGIDLSFRFGETTVIMGRSGSGKSVLLKHIIGLMQPDQGTVRIFGHDLSQLGRAQVEQLRMKFGMVFQYAALFDSMNVLQNVGFLLLEHTQMSDEEIRRKVRERLDMVGLGEIEEMMPEEISGGMKKRVALARAIVMDPRIILYDEPTTGLDPVTADTINDLIIKTGDELNATSIVVTHDIASAMKISDRIILLHEGLIRIDDKPDAVRRSDDPVVQSFLRGDASLNAHAERGESK
jgi:phospholipid/cholesterol/gamma-HCH transport system ATP-binding protein